MIGIVILNYNTFRDVVDCVKSIEDNTSVAYKIYIVDNCSSDGSYSCLKNEFVGDEKVIVLKSDYNGGYSYGNNFGVKYAINDGCEYIMISNPDVVYSKDAIEKMVGVLKSDGKIAVVGPSTPSLDQSESQLLRKVYTPTVYFFSKRPFSYLSKLIKSIKTEYDFPMDLEKPYLFRGMVRGCCFLISSALFNEIGMFDDNVFLYSEEWIIAKKICDKGYYCAFEPRARVLHKEATSTKKIGTGFQSFHLYLSAFYYIKYYTDCKSFFLIFVFLQNVVNYLIKSIIDKTYRDLLHDFIVAQRELCFGKKKKIGFKGIS